MGPLSGLFKPKNPFRTPGFIQDGLVDEEPKPPVMMPDPGPQGGMSGMLAQAPYDPPPSPMREYEQPASPQSQGLNLRGMLDQMPTAPTPQKPSGLRNVLGTIAGLYVPQLGEAIKHPGYADQQRDYAAQRQSAMDRIGAAQKITGAEANMARAGAQNNTASAQDALRRKHEAEIGHVGDFTLSDGQERFGGTTGQSIAKRDKPIGADDIEITADSGKRLGLAADKDGRYWLPKTAAGPLVTSSKPQGKPAQVLEYEATVRGENPALDDAGVSAEVAKRMKEDRDVALGLKKAQTNRANRAPIGKGGAADQAGDDDALIQDLLSAEPRSDWNNLGVKEQNRLRSKLISKGWTEPVKLGQKQKDSLELIDSLAPRLKELLAEADKPGGIAGTGMVVGHLPNAMVSEEGKRNRIRMGDVFSQIAKLRSGGAIPAPEMDRLEAFLATQTQSGGFNKVALQELIGSMENSRKHLLQRPTSTAPKDSGGATVRMKHPKTGEIRLVPSNQVADAEKANYTRVQ